MKKKLPISKMIASAALAVAAIAPSFGQGNLNLGAACGCPPVADRTTVLLSSLPGFTAINGTYGGELTSGAVLTCDKTYIIDQKIYVDSLQTLTIAPGTILKGRLTPDVVGTPGVQDKPKASALVISRGAKIIADGSADCQIIFTAEADPMDGTYAVSNIGKWGGLVLLGTATNNLTRLANGPFVAGGSGKLAVKDGLGTVEGFATSNSQNQYGVNLEAGQSFNDNDNSGILRYVSVRHSGANLAIGAEINGITLGSVGRGTTLEHIEIVSCADDNVEFFGGTANIKYLSTIFGNDDMFDYDLGWTGKAQFIFGMKSDLTSSPDSDNGFEADSDDQKSNLNPKSIPVFYNVTMIGNAKTTNTPGGDNTGMFAIAAKELTGGEFYNSVFANWKNGFNTVKVLASGRTSDSYQNWSATAGNGTNILKVKCNTFVGVTNPLTVGGDAANVLSIDTDQFAAEGNVIVAGNTLPGFDYAYTINTATNAITVKNDLTPNPALAITGCPTPMDGFFKYANYRGAFSPNVNENWLSDWSYSKMLGVTKGLAACPTDINADGRTNVNDFLQLVNEFGKDCN